MEEKMAEHLSKFLLDYEYRCRCCGKYPPDFDVKEILFPYQYFFDCFDEIREQWNAPIRVTSGYRCPMYNAMVGGKVLSAHMFGLALDLDCKDSSEVEHLGGLIEELHPDLRRGEYTKEGTFIHIDCAYFIYPRATDNWTEGVRWTG
jgi:hypothetical protein